MVKINRTFSQAISTLIPESGKIGKSDQFSGFVTCAEKWIVFLLQTLNFFFDIADSVVLFCESGGRVLNIVK